jgi:hypothetical protein
MAVFDANLMLRNTTQTISSLIGGAAGYTGSWLTLGTGGTPSKGLSFRAVIGTNAGSNTDTLSLIYEFSDDANTVKETVTRVVTGTEASGGDIITVAANRRTYVRLRVTTTGTMNNFGVVTVGVDGGDYSPLR